MFFFFFFFSFLIFLVFLGDFLDFCGFLVDFWLGRPGKAEIEQVRAPDLAALYR